MSSNCDELCTYLDSSGGSIKLENNTTYLNCCDNSLNFFNFDTYSLQGGTNTSIASTSGDLFLNIGDGSNNSLTVTCTNIIFESSGAIYITFNNLNNGSTCTFTNCEFYDVSGIWIQCTAFGGNVRMSSCILNTNTIVQYSSNKAKMTLTFENNCNVQGALLVNTYGDSGGSIIFTDGFSTNGLTITNNSSTNITCKSSKNVLTLGPISVNCDSESYGTISLLSQDTIFQGLNFYTVSTTTFNYSYLPLTIDVSNYAEWGGISVTYAGELYPSATTDAPYVYLTGPNNIPLPISNIDLTFDCSGSDPGKDTSFIFYLGTPIEIYDSFQINNVNVSGIVPSVQIIPFDTSSNALITCVSGCSVEWNYQSISSNNAIELNVPFSINFPTVATITSYGGILTINDSFTLQGTNLLINTSSSSVTGVNNKISFNKSLDGSLESQCTITNTGISNVYSFQDSNTIEWNLSDVSNAIIEYDFANAFESPVFNWSITDSSSSLVNGSSLNITSCKIQSTDSYVTMDVSDMVIGNSFEIDSNENSILQAELWNSAFTNDIILNMKNTNSVLVFGECTGSAKWTVTSDSPIYLCDCSFSSVPVDVSNIIVLTDCSNISGLFGSSLNDGNSTSLTLSSSKTMCPPPPIMTYSVLAKYRPRLENSNPKKLVFLVKQELMSHCTILEKEFTYREYFSQYTELYEFLFDEICERETPMNVILFLTPSIQIAKMLYFDGSGSFIELFETSCYTATSTQTEILITIEVKNKTSYAPITLLIDTENGQLKTNGYWFICGTCQQLCYDARFLNFGQWIVNRPFLTFYDEYQSASLLTDATLCIPYHVRELKT